MWWEEEMLATSDKLPLSNICDTSNKRQTDKSNKIDQHQSSDTWVLWRSLFDLAPVCIQLHRLCSLNERIMYYTQNLFKILHWVTLIDEAVNTVCLGLCHCQSVSSVSHFFFLEFRVSNVFRIKYLEFFMYKFMKIYKYVQNSVKFLCLKIKKR